MVSPPDSQSPRPALIAGTIGLIIGLIIAALTAFPLSLLPPPFSNILPFLALILFGYAGAWIMIMRERDIFGFFSGRLGREGGRGASKSADSANGSERMILLDTSVIIDGRVAGHIADGVSRWRADDPALCAE